VLTLFAFSSGQLAAAARRGRHADVPPARVRAARDGALRARTAFGSRSSGGAIVSGTVVARAIEHAER
jgi:hypothetical protein